MNTSDELAGRVVGGAVAAAIALAGGAMVLIRRATRRERPAPVAEPEQASDEAVELDG